MTLTRIGRDNPITITKVEPFTVTACRGISHVIKYVWARPKLQYNFLYERDHYFIVEHLGLLNDMTFTPCKLELQHDEFADRIILMYGE